MRVTGVYETVGSPVVDGACVGLCKPQQDGSRDYAEGVGQSLSVLIVVVLFNG